MEGMSIATQSAQKAAAYEREQRGGYGESIAQASTIGARSEATLSGLIQSADELLGLLGELSTRLDRVEAAIAGSSVPGSEPSAGKERSLSCITDIVDDRLLRARVMAGLLHNTVSRIERRIG